MSSRESLLAEVQFFQLLDPEERRALAEVLEESHHEVGTILFDFGDPGDCMYVVGAGAVELSDFFRRKPDAALDMMTVMGRRMRATTERLRQMAIRNAGEEAQQKLTPI